MLNPTDDQTRETQLIEVALQHAFPEGESRAFARHAYYYLQGLDDRLRHDWSDLVFDEGQISLAVKRLITVYDERDITALGGPSPSSHSIEGLDEQRAFLMLFAAAHLRRYMIDYMAEVSVLVLHGGLVAARWAHSREVEASLLTNLAEWFLVRGDSPRAFEYASAGHAAALALPSPDSLATAGSLVVLSRVLLLRGHLRESLDCLNQALSQTDAIQAPAIRDDIMMQIAMVHRLLGDQNKALAIYEELEKRQRTGSEWIDNRVKFLSNYGTCLFHAGNRERAVQMMRDALALAQAKGVRTAVPTILSSIAAMDGGEEPSTDSVGILRTARDLAKDIHDPRIMAGVLHNMTMLGEDLDQTISLLDQSLSLFRSMGDSRGEASQLVARALFSSTRGVERWAEVVSCLEAAVRIMEGHAIEQTREGLSREGVRRLLSQATVIAMSLPLDLSRRSRNLADRFVTTKGWDERRELIDANPDVTGAEVRLALDFDIWIQIIQREWDLAAALKIPRDFLAFCARNGTEAAFAQVTAEPLIEFASRTISAMTDGLVDRASLFSLLSKVRSLPGVSQGFVHLANSMMTLLSGERPARIQGPATQPYDLCWLFVVEELSRYDAREAERRTGTDATASDGAMHPGTRPAFPLDL